LSFDNGDDEINSDPLYCPFNNDFKPDWILEKVKNNKKAKTEKRRSYVSKKTGK